MPKAPSGHPPYAEMIAEAIASLKDRGGSSLAAIKKYVGSKHSLPDGWDKKLSYFLKKMTAEGKLTKVRASWKLGDSLKKKPKAKARAVVAAKKSAKAAKPAKAAAPKTAKPKAKPAGVKAKAKAAGKKAAAKPKGMKKKAPKAAKPKAKPAKKAAKGAGKGGKAKTAKSKAKAAKKGGRCFGKRGLGEWTCGASLWGGGWRLCAWGAVCCEVGARHRPGAVILSGSGIFPEENGGAGRERGPCGADRQCSNAWGAPEGCAPGCGEPAVWICGGRSRLGRLPPAPLRVADVAAASRVRGRGGRRAPI
eukprot:evm.model.scf_316.6 EVM.evm.TU.scf_316.6   scf_316:87176-88265(+)